jgi:hydrogenase maturation protease
MPGILILGYGSTLRSDDALGIHAAHALQEFYCDQAGVRVLATSQLSVELAEDVSQAQFVLFIDATEGEPPGEIFRECLEPEEQNLRFTHRCTPRMLLKAARQLHGRAPSAMGLTMTGASFDVGMGLSPEIQSRLPDLLAEAQAIVCNWRLDLRMNKLQTRPESEPLRH